MVVAQYERLPGQEAFKKLEDHGVLYARLQERCVKHLGFGFHFSLIISPTSIRKPKLYAKQVTAYDPDHKDSGFCRTVAPSLVLDLVSFQCEFAFLLHFFDRAYDCFNTRSEERRVGKGCISGSASWL